MTRRLLVCLGLAVASGCTSSQGSGTRRPSVPDPQVLRSDVRTPFAPARLRVHPLTGLSTDASGRRVITLYVEMLDAWEDSVKGVGLLTAEAIDGDRTRQWSIDLFDMQLNGPAYDPHTRTYRFVLGQLPEWIVAGSKVRVLLQTLDATGEPRDIFDEAELR